METNTSSNKFDTGKNPMAYTIFPWENEEGDFVLEPEIAKERISIWKKKQVLIHFSLSGKLVAFLGPYPNAKTYTEKVKNFFLGYFVTMPSAFEEHSLDLSFMETYVCFFWFSSPTQSKEYLAWINKVEGKKQKQWEDLGIFDMIQISLTGPRYNSVMLLASIFFWEGLTNTFQFPRGILTSTLFNVAAITGLNPLGETFTPNIETDHEFVIKRFSFKNFIIDHHNKKTEEISDKEHTLYLPRLLSKLPTDLINQHEFF